MKYLFTTLLIFVFFSFVFAQEILSAYSFSYSAGTYTEISGGTSLGAETTDDQRFVDPALPIGGTVNTGVGFPIGFDFVFNGVGFDRVAINANGWISLGQSTLNPAVNISSTSNYLTPITSTYAISPPILVSRIAGLGRDLQAQVGATLRIETIGISPNRELVVQWKNFKKYGTNGTGDSYNFQIRLQENGNKVVIAYGAMTNNATLSTAQVGLRGEPATTVTNWKNLSTDSDWTAPLPGASSDATMTLSETVYPLSGTIYTWTPPDFTTFPNPAVLAYPENGAYIFTDEYLSWGNGGGATSYDVYLGTDPNPPLLGNFSLTSIAPDLAAGTTYNWYIIARNEHGSASPSSIRSFSTPAVNQLAESFEDAWPPVGWSNIGAWSQSTSFHPHGSYGSYKYSSTSEQFILSGPKVSIDSGSNLSFKSASYTNGAILQVVYSTNRINWFQAGVDIIHPGSNTPVSTSMNLYSSGVPLGEVYIGFRTGLVSSSIYIDYILGPNLVTTLPTPATLVFPATTSTVSPNVNLVWSPDTTEGAVDSYDLYFDTVNPPLSLVAQDLLTTTYTPVLAASTSYFWKLVPKNQHGSAAGCPVWTFSTANPNQLVQDFEGQNFPPSGWSNTTSGSWYGTSTQSMEGLKSMYCTTATAERSISTPKVSVNSSSTLEFYRRSTSTGVSLQIHYSSNRVNWYQLQALSFPSYNTWIYTKLSLSSLSPGNYYFAFRSPGQTADQRIYVDYVIAPEIVPELPGTPGLSLPSSGAGAIAELPSFTWSAPTSGGIVSGYRLYLDTFSPPTSLVAETSLLLSEPPVRLQQNQTYYWTVEAYNGVGTGPRATVRSFTTRSDYTQTTPYLQTFNDGTSLTDIFWSKNGFVYISSTHGNSGSNGLYSNLDTTNRLISATTPPIGPLPIGAGLIFEYRLIDYSGYPANPTNLGPNDNIVIQAFSVVDNCFYDLYTINASNHTPGTAFVPLTLSLASFANDTVYIRFQGNWGQGDYYLDIDNMAVGQVSSEPVLSLSPDVDEWDFGSIYQGCTLVKEFTITNLGVADLELGGVNTTGDQYSISIPPSSYSLATGQSTSFTVQFLPTAVGGPFSGSLVITDNRANRSIALLGSCIAPQVVPITENFGTDGVWPFGWQQTISGALTTNKWAISNTSNAGGSPYELKSTWQDATGVSRLISPPLDTAGIPGLKLLFKQFYNDYGAGVTAKIQFSHDLLTWYDTHWSLSSGNGDVTESTLVNIGPLNGDVTYLSWVLDGNHFQYDYWYIDDVSIDLPVDNDIAVISWDLPKQVVNVNSIITPKATIRNLGLSSQTFDLICTIGQYCNTQQVLNLPSGESRQISFSSFTPELGLKADVLVEAILPADSNPLDNTVSSLLACAQLDRTGLVCDYYSHKFYNFRLGQTEDMRELAIPSDANTYINAADWVNGKWLVERVGNSEYSFCHINPFTGSSEVVSSGNGWNFEGIAYNNNDNAMYAVDSWNIYTIDYANGNLLASYYIWCLQNGSPVSFSDIGGQLRDIVYDSNNNILYGLDPVLDRLWRINPITGEAYNLGQLGIDWVYYDLGAAFDIETGSLYLTQYQYPTGSLFMVDTANGRAYKVGDFIPGGLYDGFAIPYGYSQPEVSNSFANIQIDMNSTYSGMDLTDYFSCQNSPLEFSLTNAENFSYNISPSGELEITPNQNWFGTAYLTIRATNVGREYVEQILTVTVQETWSYTEDFDHEGSFPAGWSMQHTGTTTYPWQAYLVDGTNYAMKTYATTGHTAIERLLSPVFNLSSYENVSVSFDTNFLRYGTGTGTFAYSLNNSTWNSIEVLNTAYNGRKSFVLPVLDRKTSVYFRWSYVNSSPNLGNDNYWIVDNFNISGRVVDNLAPTLISDLSVLDYGTDWVRLGWSPSSDLYFAKYEIYISDDSEVTSSDRLWTDVDDPALGVMTSEQTTISIEGEGSYWFGIRALDQSSNTSAISPTVSVTIAFPPVLSDPLPGNQPLPVWTNNAVVTISCRVTDLSAIEPASIMYRYDRNANGSYDIDETWMAIPRSSYAARNRIEQVIETQVTLQNDGVIAFEFKASDIHGNTGFSGANGANGIEDDWVVRLDRLSPAFSLPVPAAGTWSLDRALNIGASVFDLNDLDFSSLEYRCDLNVNGTYDATETWQPIQRLSQSSGSRETENIFVPVTFGNDGYASFEFKIRDAAGNIGYSGTSQLEGISDDWTAQIDTQAPQFSSPLPAQDPSQQWLGALELTIGAHMSDFAALDISSIRYRVDMNRNGVYDATENWQTARSLHALNSRQSEHDFSVQITVPQDGNYRFEIKVTDINGHTAFSGTSQQEGIEDDWLIRVDTTPPAEISTFVVMDYSAESIQLAWLPSSDANFAGYVVCYSELADPGLDILFWDSDDDPNLAFAGSGFVSTTVSSLIPGTRYYFWLKAVDQFGWETAYNGFVTAMTASSAPPKAPENVLISINGDELILDWDDVVQDILGNPITATRYDVFVGGSPDFTCDSESYLTTTVESRIVLDDMVQYADYLFFKITTICGSLRVNLSPRK